MCLGGQGVEAVCRGSVSGLLNLWRSKLSQTAYSTATSTRFSLSQPMPLGHITPTNAGQNMHSTYAFTAWVEATCEITGAKTEELPGKWCFGPTAPPPCLHQHQR